VKKYPVKKMMILLVFQVIRLLLLLMIAKYLLRKRKREIEVEGVPQQNHEKVEMIRNIINLNQEKLRRLKQQRI